MIYETTQLLCNSYYSTNEQHLISNIYKEAYKNHPCSKHCKRSIENFEHLHCYLGFLFDSYFRSGGTAWQRELELFKEMIKFKPSLPRQGYVDPPYLAFGSEDKQLHYKLKAFQQQVGIWNPNLKLFESGSFENAVQAYRSYYRLKQFKNNKFPKWTKNKQPDWYCRSEICVIGD